MNGGEPSALAFIGDVHLDEGEPAVDAFIECLDRLAQANRRIVLMGDLFNLWIAQPEFEGEHHRSVVKKLRELRAQGADVRYLEGNRDYRIAARYVGSAFKAATDKGFADEFAGRKLFSVHGDLANAKDIQYRTWRTISRSALFWSCVGLVPRGQRRRLAEKVEQRMRASNQNYKRKFPEPEIRAYAAEFFASGFDCVVLGHFHTEKELPPASSADGRIFVLPEWKGSRRHLEVDRDGTVAFVPSPV